MNLASFRPLILGIVGSAPCACTDSPSSTAADTTPVATTMVTGTATGASSTAPPDTTRANTTATTQAATTESASTGSPPARGAPRIYASGGGSITVWSMDEQTGALTLLQTMKQGTEIGPLVAHPDAHRLYAARTAAQQIASFSIDPVTGELAELAAVDVGHRPVYMSVDVTNQWLLSADFGDDLVFVFPITADVVAGPPSETQNVQARPHAILQDSTGAYVFVPHLQSNLIEQYLFDASTGTLSPNRPASVAAPAGAGARHMVFSPTQDLAYVVNESSSSVSVYAYDPSVGTLSLGATFDALPKGFDGNNAAADIHITPDGNVVYASMRGHDSIAVFAATDDGMLQWLSNAPTQPGPRAFGLSPFAQHLYVAGQDSGLLEGYAIQADGSLVAQASYKIGSSPLWVLGLELPAAR